jgi:hypothetical protein
MRVKLIFIRDDSPPGPRSYLRLSLSVLLALSLPAHCFDLRGSAAGVPGAFNAEARREVREQSGGVSESVPDKYLKRYLRWKAEYLSTEAGRRQWQRYAADEHFALKVTVSPQLGQGGLVSDYKWDEAGRLVGASITLGVGLDGGLPPSLYYPVTSALAAAEESDGLTGDILAAAKMAHEFGHVNRAADTGAALFERQNRLAADYARLFEESGYNARDPRLAEVTRMLGGTPFDVKREREHRAEANALVFLQERMSAEAGKGALFKQIRKSIEEYGEKHLQFR